jgi:hypothetical protein
VERLICIRILIRIHIRIRTVIAAKSPSEALAVSPAPTGGVSAGSASVEGQYR